MSKRLKTEHPLRRWRAANGISLVNMAEQIGVTEGFLSLVESDNRGLSLQNAAKLAGITGIPLEEFVRVGRPR